MSVVFADLDVGQAVPGSVDSNNGLGCHWRVQSVSVEVSAVALRADAEAEAADAVLTTNSLSVEFAGLADVSGRSNDQNRVRRHKMRSHAVDDLARVGTRVDWLDVGAGQGAEAVVAGGFALFWDVSPIQTPDNQRNWISGGAARNVEDEASLKADSGRWWGDDGRCQATDFIGVVAAIGLRVALEGFRDALAVGALELVVTARTARRC